MNKSDLKLVLILLIISLSMLGLIKFTKPNGSKIAQVYYQNDLVLSIPLSQNLNKTYTVHGYNGDVVIEVANDKIRVVEEISPLHLCSKQGWIKETYETIVCLPNKVVIKIEASDELDAIVE